MRFGHTRDPLLVSTFVLAIACGGPTPIPSKDDAGLSNADSGTVMPPDAGTPGNGDAGAPLHDAGTAGTDAGDGSAVDAGTPAPSHSMGTIVGDKTTIAISSLKIDALDVLTAFWTDDATTWYSDYSWCNAGNGNSVTFNIAHGGELVLTRNTCTSAAKSYQVAWRPAAQRLSGTIASFPTTLHDAVFSVSQLPSLSVYYSDDHGKSWYSQYEYCNGGEAFMVREGSLTISSTYCTSRVTDYQVATRPGTRHYSGAVTQFPMVIADAGLGFGSLPNVTVYWSGDHGTSWYSEYKYCNGGRTFTITNGKLTLNNNFCTGGATNYHVVIDDD